MSLAYGWHRSAPRPRTRPLTSARRVMSRRSSPNRASTGHRLTQSLRAAVAAADPSRVSRARGPGLSRSTVFERTDLADVGVIGGSGFYELLSDVRLPRRPDAVRPTQ